MEKPIYPSVNMRITQGYQEGTHKGSFAIDEAGIDENISKIKAPYTGIIKKIYPNDANEVWLESIEKVEYPDGTIDYMTILFAHADDVNDLFVGKRINQGEEFYSEGTKGNTSGNHCHIECGQGKFAGTGWHKNENGYYSINNGKKPEDCLWINETITIISDNNYNFKKLHQNNVENEHNTKTEEETKMQELLSKKEITTDQNQKQEESKAMENQTNTLNILTNQENEITNYQTNTQKNTTNQESKITESQTEKIQNTSENAAPKLIFTCKKSDLYGIYLNENEKLYIEK